MRRHLRAPSTVRRSAGLALLVVVACTGCTDDAPLPPRDVDALLLSHGDASDTVARTVLRRHRELMHYMATRDPRAADYLSISFAFGPATPASAKAALSGRGPIPQRDYFQTLTQGLPAAIVAADSFVMLDYAEKYAAVATLGAPHMSVTTQWLLRSDGWRAMSMYVFERADTMKGSTLKGNAVKGTTRIAPKRPVS